MTSDYVPNNLYKFLEEKGRSYKIPKGQVFQSSDMRQALNLVKSGYVKRYLIANDGALKVQGIWGPGAVFPLTIAFKVLFSRNIYESPEIYHYQTVKITELYTVDHATLTAELRDNPLLVKDLLFEAGKRLESNIQRLENLGLKTSYHRLAHQLLYFGKTDGLKTTKGIQICIPLSHQDIADNLSLTRETVTTNMKELRSKKLISTSSSNKLIVIPNLEKLEKEAFS